MAAALYPVGLVVDGRRCLVVGGGRVAARKAEGLVAAGADVHVVAPEVSAAVRDLGVSWEERPYRAGEVAGYHLVVSATGREEVSRRVHADAEAAGVLVNTADDPARCSFVLPAVLRRGPVAVAVSTGGASPALASWLRSRLEEHVGPEVGVLAGLLADERASIRAAGRSTEGIDWRRAFDSDMLDLIRAGQVDKARERLQRCLSSS